MEDCILKINLIVFITLTIFYLYQFIYVAVVLFKKHKERQHTLCPFHRYGVVLGARQAYGNRRQHGCHDSYGSFRTYRRN